MSVNDKYVQILFASGDLKKFQFPQAFDSYLKIDDELLLEEILKEDKLRKQKEDAEKIMLVAKQNSEKQHSAVSLKTSSEKKASNSVSPKTMSLAKEVSREYNGVIIDADTFFTTHAETLNSCFGFNYKHFQKAYKDLGNGYAVWFPRIARKAGNKYLSTDNYWGWQNIISENGDTITQRNNPDYPYEKEPDKNKRIIFARFDSDNRYKFIGVYAFEQIQNGEVYTRIGTKINTKTMEIIE